MEEQALTIDVVPQTVTEVIYLNSQDINFEKTVEVDSYYSSSEEQENENEAYEIGCVDATQVEDMPLVYDQSESFVMLPEVYQAKQQGRSYLSERKLKKAKQEKLVDSSGSDEEYTRSVRHRKITCRICKMKFTSRKKLFQHRVLHKSNIEKPVKSNDNCDYTYNNFVYKSTKEIHVCKVCGEEFERTQALSIHFRKCHQTVPVNVVPQSQKSNIETPSRFETKDQNCNETPKYSCSICGCPCVNEFALLFHYKKHEPKVYSCSLCEAGYNDENEFFNHKKTHDVQFLYACNKCDESFPTTALVSYHIRHVHAKNDFKPTAFSPPVAHSEDCFEGNVGNCYPDTNSTEMKYNEISELQQNQEAFFEDSSLPQKKRFNCNICNSKFRSQGALTRHKTQHILNSEKESNVNLK